MTSAWPASWTQAFGGSFTTPPPWNARSAHTFHASYSWSRLQGRHTWESNLSLSPFGRGWTLLRPLYKLKIVAGGRETLFVLWLQEPSLVRKSPCMLNLPPTNLGWPASSVSFCLPCVWASLWANSYPSVIPAWGNVLCVGFLWTGAWSVGCFGSTDFCHYYFRDFNWVVPVCPRSLPFSLFSCQVVISKLLHSAPIFDQSLTLIFLQFLFLIEV